MPQYGRIKYGRSHKYGRYVISTDDSFSIGPHVRYRIQSRVGDMKSPLVTMITERIEMNARSQTPIRIRCNDGEWIQTRVEEIEGPVYKVRIRSVGQQESSPWVYGERAELREN